MKSLKVTYKNEIALVEWDLPQEKVNKLSLVVLEELEEVIEALKKSKPKASVFISRKRGIFVAGADVKEIKNLKTKVEFERASKKGQDIFHKIEKLNFPVVMAIEGACLGGGLELALSGHYRIASDHPKTQIGLPEVLLGLIPGFGGCYRLPRLIGFSKAVNLITTGRSLDAKKAFKMGVVDECVPSSVLEERSLKVAADLAKKKKKRKFWPVSNSTERVFHTYLGRLVFLKIAKKEIFKKTKGFYPAPLEALNTIHGVYKKTSETGYLRERKGFSSVADTDVSRHLIDLFFLREGRKKVQALQGSSETPQSIKKVGVLGAGVMGGGISYLLADKKISTRMKDIKKEYLAKGFEEAHRIWNGKVKKRKLTKFQKEEKKGFLSGSLSYSGFENLDLVIEAVVEDMQVKKNVFKDLGQHVNSNCIVATNTSSLSVSEMAKSYKNPENFLGLHFFNPVFLMPLVEVIRGEKTSEKSLVTAFELCKKIGKIPVVVKDSPGFLVNRLLFPILSEALFFLEEGMDIQKIDNLYTYKFGLPMGVFRLMDEVGLDVCLKVLKSFQKNLKDDIQISELCDEKLFGNEFLGKKTKKGFYIYDNKGNPKEVNQALLKNLNVKSKKIPDEKALKRGIYLMINEASKALLEEKIVASPQDVDLAMIMGAGFPPFRGGLLKYADSVGAGSIVSDLEEFNSFLGKRFKASPSLIEMANNSSTFY